MAPRWVRTLAFPAIALAFGTAAQAQDTIAYRLEGIYDGNVHARLKLARTETSARTKEELEVMIGRTWKRGACGYGLFLDSKKDDADAAYLGARAQGRCKAHGTDLAWQVRGFRGITRESADHFYGIGSVTRPLGNGFHAGALSFNRFDLEGNGFAAQGPLVEYRHGALAVSASYGWDLLDGPGLITLKTSVKF